MKQGIYTIVEHTPLTKDVYRMVLSGHTSAMTMPGQFVESVCRAFSAPPHFRLRL